MHASWSLWLPQTLTGWMCGGCLKRSVDLCFKVACSDLHLESCQPEACMAHSLYDCDLWVRGCRRSRRTRPCSPATSMWW